MLFPLLERCPLRQPVADPLPLRSQPRFTFSSHPLTHYSVAFSSQHFSKPHFSVPWFTASPWERTPRHTAVVQASRAQPGLQIFDVKLIKSILFPTAKYIPCHSNTDLVGQKSSSRLAWSGRWSPPAGKLVSRLRHSPSLRRVLLHIISMCFWAFISCSFYRFHRYLLTLH